MTGYADVIRDHQNADYGTKVEDYDDDAPTWAEAQADVDHEQPWTSPIGPCPTCGTGVGDCRPPGCCATCQRFAEDDLRGPKWRHMDPIWGRA